MLTGHLQDEHPLTNHSSDTGSHVRAVPAGPQAELDSVRLLQGRREVLIRHGGECYRLRHTRNDKLILTK